MSYVNPFNATSPDGPEYTDLSFGFVPFFRQRYAFDFGANIPVRVTQFGFKHRDAITKTIELWGSNVLPTWTAPDIDSFWTALGSTVNPIADWNFINTTNTSFWRYLKIKTSDSSSTMSLHEIELYNSSILSPTENFA